MSLPAGNHAVEKQHDLAAFAQHGDADHDGQRQQRFRALDDGLPGRAQFAGEFGAVARHPDIVPGEHHDGERQDRGVEHFLPHAGEQVRQGAGKGRDHAGRENAGEHAAGDPLIAMRHRARDREHDADDQAGLEDFTEYDDQCGNHGVFLLYDQRPAGDLLVILVEELVAARLSGRGH